MRVARGTVGIEEPRDTPKCGPLIDQFLAGLTNRNAAMIAAELASTWCPCSVRCAFRTTLHGFAQRRRIAGPGSTGDDDRVGNLVHVERIVRSACDRSSSSSSRGMHPLRATPLVLIAAAKLLLLLLPADRRRSLAVQTRTLVPSFLAAMLASCAGAMSTPPPVPDATVPEATLPQVPLRTNDRWIVDAHGDRFKIAGVSWYGAEELDFVVAGLEVAPVRDIARRVRELGFNVVRIPWSNELVETNPMIASAAVAANPELAGLRALDVLDAVVDACADEGLLVILDNHIGKAGWCCDQTEDLWYSDAYPEATWISHWRTMAARYVDQRAVVAVDLRNEPRGRATWGGSAATDWHAAATRAGNAVLAVNPNLLVIVEGIGYASDLHGPWDLPVVLDVPDRLVYSPHDYAWFHPPIAHYDELKTALGNAWGYILNRGQRYTAPILVGEFGTCHTSPACIGGPGATSEGMWFEGFRRYLVEADIDWIYWPLNGTQARAPGRDAGAADTYGVLDATWTMPSQPQLAEVLRQLQPATQWP